MLRFVRNLTASSAVPQTAVRRCDYIYDLSNLLNTKISLPLRSLGSVVVQPKLKDFTIANEPILTYRKDSAERKALKQALETTAATCEEVPIVIGGKEYKTDKVMHQVMPHNHAHKLAKFYYADKKLLEKAIETAVEAQVKWDRVPLPERLAIWEHAADLMAGKYRQALNAATMLGQAKTVIQAEIDAACELIDFIR